MKKIYLFIFLITTFFTVHSQVQNYSLNDVVDDFTVTDIHGEEHNLYSITAAGKYVFIDFSFTTCGPCQSVAPIFNEFYDKYGCGAGEIMCFTMFGINNDHDSAVENFENTYGGSFNHAPAISNDGGAIAVDVNFGVNQYPTTCVINPENKIIVLDIWPITSVANYEAKFPADFNPTPMSCTTSVSHFTAQTDEGQSIEEGSIFTYNALGEVDAKLTFNVTNTGSETVEMKIELVSWSQADGTGTYLCLFGNCLPPGGLTPGGIYTGPDNLIAPGVTSTTDNHFYNTYEGDGVNYPIDYVFKLFEVNASGDEIGVPITFTYRYDGTASLEENAQVTYQLYPNVSSDKINLNIQENVTVQILNLQGQVIKKYNFEAGNHQIDVSSFSKQLYLVRLTNAQGRTSLAKIIVK